MLYEVRVAANKGLGLFAKRSILRGTRILAEKPLIALRPGQRPTDVLSYAKELDANARQKLLDLSWYPGHGIKKWGRWCAAFGWAIRSRAATVAKTAQAQESAGSRKVSANAPGSLGETVKGIREAFRILGIFRSNSFDLGSANLPPGAHSSTSPPGVSSSSAGSRVVRKTISSTDAIMLESRPKYALALFPAIARINHSCTPNAQANYHPLHRTFNVHATRDITAGEEVSINYLPEHGQLRSQRVSKLQDGYGFTCNCAACDLGTFRGQQGEQSRKMMHSEIQKMKALFSDSMDVTETAAGYGADGMPETLVKTTSDEEQRQINELRMMPGEDRKAWLLDRELEVLNAMLAMYEAEGIVGREVASMHYHIARLQRSIGSHSEAIANAEAGLKLEEACLGTDHPGYTEALALVEGMREEMAMA